MSDYDETDLPPIDPPAEEPITEDRQDFIPTLQTSLLGACLVNPSNTPMLAEALHLLSRRHRLIAEAMLALTDSDPGDVMLLRKELNSNFDTVGGHEYLMHLMGGVPKSANARFYLTQLKEAQGKLDAAKSLQAAAEAIEGGDPRSIISDLIDAASHALSAATERPRLQTMNLESILADPPMDPPWVIPNWLAAGDKVIFAAQSGYGKSYVLLDLALALTTGQPFLGIDLVGGPQRVTIIDEENPEIQDARRLQHLMRGRELDLCDVRELPLRLIVAQNMRLQDDAIEQLRRELDENPTDWLFLDSLVRFIGGQDESASKDMSAWFSEKLDPIRRDYGVGIIALHHIRKPGGGQFGGGGDPLHAVRGSGDIAAWPDAVWSGLKDGKARTLQVSKTRWGGDCNVMNIELEEGGDIAGSTRLLACEEDTGAELFVQAKLTMAAEKGLLRQELIDEYAEDIGCAKETATKAVSRAIWKLKKIGRIEEGKEGRKKRYWLGGSREEED